MNLKLKINYTKEIWDELYVKYNILEDELFSFNLNEKEIKQLLKYGFLEKRKDCLYFKINSLIEEEITKENVVSILEKIFIDINQRKELEEKEKIINLEKLKEENEKEKKIYEEKISKQQIKQLSVGLILIIIFFSFVAFSDKILNFNENKIIQSEDKIEYKLEKQSIQSIEKKENKKENILTEKTNLSSKELIEILKYEKLNSEKMEELSKGLIKSSLEVLVFIIVLNVAFSFLMGLLRDR